MIQNFLNVICLGIALTWMDQSPARAADRESQRPNVIVILTDDMGYADLGCYGSRDIKTPHLDRLAAQGVRLTNFYSSGPVCTPTRAALMTGRWQQRVGLEWAIGPGLKEPGLPTREITLPRMLKNAGYATALFGKWHLGYKPEFGPNAHGFDEFFGLLSGNVDHYSHREINDEADWYENTTPVEVTGYSTDLITDRATAFVRRERPAGTPFFLYVAYNAVHWPFQAPGRPADVRQRANWFAGTRQDYAAMSEAVDTGVGKILAALDEQKQTASTLVIFTDDNGGERLSDMGPLFHHKATLWEGGIHVPCILRCPGNLPAGKVSDQPAITHDLTATILAACRVVPPADRKLDGLDLAPLLTGTAPPAPRTFFWRIQRADRSQRAVRHGNLKFVRDGNIELLFDLAKDVGERKDISYEHPEQLAELRRRLADWEAEMAQEKPEFTVR
ncbi:MAG TPA: sulfatase-like hydrolase/transferase [Planctomycetaceae bacterium]|jgi:arylsulfatase A-like enzyme